MCADTGRKIERFTPFERAAHWTNAIAFVVLAISGIVMAFGKFFLLPVIGATLFGWLSYALKTSHNFAGPLFAVSLLVVFVTFVRDNLPRAGDLAWLAKGGGLLGAQEVPSHRFNAGEKIVFWGGVFLLGLIVVGSGLVLDQLVPGLAYLRGDMQIAHMIHCRRGAADDGDVPRPHLHRHDRHEGRLQGHAHRLSSMKPGPRSTMSSGTTTSGPARFRPSGRPRPQRRWPAKPETPLLREDRMKRIVTLSVLLLDRVDWRMAKLPAPRPTKPRPRRPKPRPRRRMAARSPATSCASRWTARRRATRPRPRRPARPSRRRTETPPCADPGAVRLSAACRRGRTGCARRRSGQSPCQEDLIVLAGYNGPMLPPARSPFHTPACPA